MYDIRGVALVSKNVGANTAKTAVTDFDGVPIENVMVFVCVWKVSFDQG